ncbi:claudin-11a [Hoplias malabaricus]|uniref:claudin-11a n=1 Tax=Hoplias malabaricus TaxID=27720 RepID=UPI003461CD6E
MANTCLQLTGFLVCLIGWVGLIIATVTNDWVVICKYGMNTCRKMDELGTKGLWTECVISTALYHCSSLTQILDLPAYMQTARALMVLACLLGLPASAVLLVSMPCVNLGGEEQGAKDKQILLGGSLTLIVALCGIVSTVWFPIGAHSEPGLMAFGFSLYAGWVGAAFSLLGGCLMVCCSVETSAPYSSSNRFYYSKHEQSNPSIPGSSNHAKSAHV